MQKDCTKDHSIFVPDIVGIPDEGKVVVILVCTRCGEVNFVSEQVSNGAMNLRLLREEKDKGA